VPKSANTLQKKNKRLQKERTTVAGKGTKFLLYMKRFYWLYLFLIPGMVAIYLFRLQPMYGLQIAFRDFSIVKGVWGSPWVGLKHFETLFKSANFVRVFKNSIITSVLQLVCSFPAPIILALLLNEVRLQRYKKTLQTIMYLPHFISWVVVISMVTGLLSQSGGIINTLIVKFGGEKIAFLTSTKWFRPVLIISNIWKESGWGTVIYLAALAGIDPQLYEAAEIDGANRWHSMRYITLPCIVSTILVMLIMKMGSVLNNSFEVVWLLQNNVNKSVAEVLETYSYQVGLREGRYSFAAAIGFFQSVVGCIMVFTSNWLAKRNGGSGLW